ncbi:MAG TPA: hypothetical protein VG248_14040 [Caulobacteraceae bacterium]|nr:hypothetical protein [Caulobacteraceae bacterium]
MPAATAAGAAVWLAIQGAASAQSVPAGPPSPMTATAPAAAMVKIPEGTEIRLQLREKLSSATSAEGDTFEVFTAEEIRLTDGTVIPAGYSGRGEVTHVEHTGWMGKSGQLNIKVDYLKIGESRVRLRGSKGGEGKGNTGNLVAAVVVFGVFGAAVHGHSVVYPEGTPLTAYVDQDTSLPLPVAAPPRVG